MKTLLQIIQANCMRSGVGSPAAVFSSTDDMIVQMRELVNEGLEELRVKYKWPQAELTASFTSTGAESQGAMETIAPGFLELIPGTFWNLTNKLPGQGSVSPENASILSIWGSPNAVTTFEQSGGNFLFKPAQPVGLSYQFKFRTRYLVIDGDSGALKEYFTKDNDLTVLPDNLHTLDLRWRWKAEKGLAYAENMDTFERICKQTAANAAAKPTLSMSGPNRNAMPGIVVPIGNWNA